MNIIEILAPVGGQEQLVAAVRSGADAVYLGGSSFNARSSAENFDGEGLVQTVKYCHGRGVAVHVTLNTLFKDREIGELVAQIQEIGRSGADAVIVQDLGTARLVREMLPNIGLHGSTQLSTHNVQGALLLKEMGFSRVVLAREMDFKEIAQIKKESGMEVEVFIHGALCVSMSGSCYLSAMWGGRSGNRGSCAQPCRLDFTSKMGRDHALSLKDLSGITQMSRYIAAGVDSVKIEGRMKRAEYVAAAVTACKQAVNKEFVDMDRVTAVFSRSGFTSGYLDGKRNLDMFGYRRREDVVSATPAVLQSVASQYRNEVGLLGASVSVKILKDQPAEMEFSCKGKRVEAVGEIPQIAINRPTDQELVKRSVEKLGGTPFFLEKLDVVLDDGIMLPVSAINQMRKQCCDDLLKSLEHTHEHKYIQPDYPLEHHPKFTNIKHCENRVRVRDLGQVTDLVIKYADVLIVPVDKICMDGGRIDGIIKSGTVVVGELPQFIFNSQLVDKWVKNLHEKGIDSLVVGSVGSLAIAKENGFKIFGDYGLNVTNSHCLKSFAQLSVENMTLSFENNITAVRQMGDYIPYGIVSYGHLPVMTFRNCPARGEKGCGECSGENFVTDRKGIKMPIVCQNREYSQMLNPIPLQVNVGEFDVDFHTVYFTVETPSQCDFIVTGGKVADRTKGLYFAKG